MQGQNLSKNEIIQNWNCSTAPFSGRISPIFYAMSYIESLKEADSKIFDLVFGS